MTTPSSHDTGLGELFSNTIGQELSNSAGDIWKPKSTYCEEDRYLIAKYANNHGASQVIQE